MSEFLYFLPNVQRATLAIAREAGLGYAFDASPTAPTTTQGPNGLPGATLSRTHKRTGYYPDRQTWRPMLGNVDVWVGMWNDSPPTPEDLARDSLVDGKYLTLEDGHQWLIPKAREYVEHEGELLMRNNLPLSYGVNMQGELVPDKVKPRFQSFWDSATAYIAAQLEAETKGEATWTMADNVTLVEQAFQTNYRVATTELGLLGVWDTEMRNAVRDIAVDMERILAFAKKKQIEAELRAENSLPSSDGHGVSSEDSQQPTGQQLPTGTRSTGESIAQLVEVA